ncbi:MAG: roadblock/LC7 domain-containing protein [Candidatus Marinimicrobia bacterium]|nr:roadblock/LC7 domain-containing protein [Candidatus Neomarinimicrobiota bacterium]
MALSLMEEDIERLGRTMRNLLERSEADGCLLCDGGGYVLSQEGLEQVDPLLLSALGAGVFAASRELARVLGEDEFSAVFHQGEVRSIFIRAVTADVLLVIIFSRGAHAGLVKHYAAPAVAELKTAFEQVAAREHRVPHRERSFVLTQNGPLFERE